MVQGTHMQGLPVWAMGSMVTHEMAWLRLQTAHGEEGELLTGVAQQQACET